MTQIVCASERIAGTWRYGPHEVLGEVPDRCPECGMALYGSPSMVLSTGRQGPRGYDIAKDKRTAH